MEISSKVKKQNFRKMAKAYFTSRRIAYLAIFSSMAALLNMFVRLSLPIFPGFLSFSFADVPALIAGFMLGPVSGMLVVVFGVGLRLALVGSTTFGVGDVSNLLLGLSFVLAASLIYKKWRTHKGAVIGLVIGSLVSTLMALLVNRFITIPLFSLAVDGGIDTITNWVRPFLPLITVESFYRHFLLGAVLPFNLLRTVGSAIITYVLYSSLKRADKRLFGEKKTKTKVINIEKHNSIGNNNNNKFISSSVENTIEIAKELASKLKGGDIVLLSGDVGAGKTVFSKGLALGLNVNETILSPTFAIMNNYDTASGLAVCHIDAYRLTSEEEALEAGLSDFIGDSNTISLVEWHENISGFFANNKCVHVRICKDSNSDNEFFREITLS